jgi:hypothetical protein
MRKIIVGAQVSMDGETRPARCKRNPRHRAHHHRVAAAELATRLLVDCRGNRALRRSPALPEGLNEHFETILRPFGSSPLQFLSSS